LSCTTPDVIRARLLPLLFLVGCAQADARFETPERAVRTLLGAYDLADVPEQVVRDRLAARGTFTLKDEVTFRESFLDHETPYDDGAAGYVLGRVAAAKDHLTFATHGDRVHVTAGTERLAVLERTEDGYRIVLAASVPRHVRTQLREVYRRRSEQLARRGVRG
jgi:hypothetical protein